MNDPSAGEISGIFAGIVALLGSLGAGVRWVVITRKDARISHEQKLEKWEIGLNAREAKIESEERAYRAAIEAKLAALDARHEQMSREHSALRLAFEIVASEIRAKDPMNPALKRAEQLLQAAFPLMPAVPSDMAQQLQAIDRAEAAHADG